MSKTTSRNQTTTKQTNKQMDNTPQPNDTLPNFEFHYDGPTDTIGVYAHCVMQGIPCRGWLTWAPMVEGVLYAPLFRLSPRRDRRSLDQLKSALGPFHSPPPIMIDLKHFKGLPIETAPKDGTPILIHEPSQGGWIQAHWEDEKKTTGRPAQWCSEHHCDWFSELRPDLWLPLPGGGK